MISKELLRENYCIFRIYGVYIDNLEDNEKLEEFADIIKILKILLKNQWTSL